MYSTDKWLPCAHKLNLHQETPLAGRKMAPYGKWSDPLLWGGKGVIWYPPCHLSHLLQHWPWYPQKGYPLWNKAALLEFVCLPSSVLYRASCEVRVASAFKQCWPETLSLTLLQGARMWMKTFHWRHFCCQNKPRKNQAISSIHWCLIIPHITHYRHD